MIIKDGDMGNFAYLALLLFIFAVFVMLPASGVLTSQSGEFNVTPGLIFLNYTNNYSANITIGNTETFILNLNITNSSSKTYVVANYSQPNKHVVCTNSDTGSLYIFAKNATGSYSNVFINDGKYENVSLYISSSTLTNCYPGRYYGNLTVMNYTNSGDNVTIYIAVDIPITANVLNKTTGVGNFSAAMQGNATYYHSYYFNASEIENATSVRFNISLPLVEMFLFDASGNYLARSVNNNLIYSYLAPDSMYELRVYGNITNATSSPYNITIMYSTLNATNVSDSGLRVSEIDFGKLNVSDYNIQNITLRNEGNITYPNVVEGKEIYYVKRWNNNVSMDREFLVPSFATKIKVAVNWTNTSQNYSLYLTAPNKTLVGSSVNRFINANFTGAEMEEYVETTDISAGYWNVSVRNNTPAVMDNYTLAVFVWYPASEWIATNYTAMTFNSTGNNNYTSDINITLTVPNNTINGDFEGFINYTSSYGSVLEIPIKATANASSLVVNQTLSSSVVKIDENIGFNTTRVLNITLNNTGLYPLSFTVANSSSALWNGNKYINFTYEVPASPLSAESNHLINITLNITTITTENTKGIYEGYIYFNSTEARPYQGFNLTLRVNLTDALAFSSITIRTRDADEWINKIWMSEDVTSVFKLFYVNDTNTEVTDMNTSNITSIWLSNANISYRIPVSGTLAVSNGTDSGGLYCPIGCPGGSSLYGNYFVNATVPANIPGGFYEVHLIVNYTRADGYKFNSEGIAKYLRVNQTGLNMTLNTYPSSTNNNTEYRINVTVTNYGLYPSTGAKITLNKWSSLTIQSNGITNCTTPESAVSTADVNLIALGHGESCYISWVVKTGSSAGTGTSTINGTAGAWFGNLSFSTTISVPSGSTQNSNTGSNQNTNNNQNTDNQNTATDTFGLKIISYPDEVKVQQNSSKSVNITVNNSGTLDLTNVKVFVEGINQSWYSASGLQAISKAENKDFTITFNIPASAEPKKYSITFKANSSDSDVSDVKSSYLIVNPDADMQKEIEEKISNYNVEYDRIYYLINKTESLGGNVTEAKVILDNAKVLIDQANSYIQSGNYVEAYALLGQIESYLKDAEAKITAAKPKGSSGGINIWLIIGIVAFFAVVGLGVYLMLPVPSGGYDNTGYLYVNPEVRGRRRITIVIKKLREIKEKIKEFIDRIKEKAGRGKNNQKYSFKPGEKYRPYYYGG